MVRFPSLALVLMLAGCGPAEDRSQEAAAPGPNDVHVVAADYAYQLPDTIPAGPTRFHLENRGTELHHLVLVQLIEGKTLGDLAAVNLETGPPPAWIRFVGGPNSPAPGSTSVGIVTLEPGSYALLCVIPSPDGKLHVAKGMARALTVVPGGETRRLPAADLTMTLNDFDFVLSAPLTAGRHVIRVETAQGQPHEVFLARLEPGKTAQDLLRWIASMQGPPPGVAMGGATFIPGGGFNLIEVDLQPGEYALICFLPDATDGKPHFVHGMVKQLTVS